MSKMTFPKNVQNQFSSMYDPILRPPDPIFGQNGVKQKNRNFPKIRRKNVKNDFSQKCPKSIFQHVGPYSKASRPIFRPNWANKKKSSIFDVLSMFPMISPHFLLLKEGLWLAYFPLSISNVSPIHRPSLRSKK